MVDRQELHNTHIDHTLALAGRCGNLRLATGARCRREARHRGSCDFVPPSGEPSAADPGEPGTATEREAQ